MTDFYDDWTHLQYGYPLMTNDKARQCLDYFKLHGSPSDLLPSHFIFRMVNLDFDIFTELIDIFKISTSLTSLEIYGFDLQRLRKLAELVDGNLYLQKLRIYFEGKICKTSVEIVIDIIKRHPILKSLYFGSNWVLSDKRAERLIRSLGDNSSLRMVGFSVYRSFQVKESFIDVLSINSTLEKIRFVLPTAASLDPRIKKLLERNRDNRRMRDAGLMWQLLENGVLVDM